jgi:arginine decarboxylase
MGLPFNLEAAWDEKEQLFKSSGRIIKTTNTTQSATGDKDSLWTTVIAAAVFVP